MCARMGVYVCICMRAFVRVFLHLCAQTFARVFISVCVCVCICMCACVCICVAGGSENGFNRRICQTQGAPKPKVNRSNAPSIFRHFPFYSIPFCYYVSRKGRKKVFLHECPANVAVSQVLLARIFRHQESKKVRKKDKTSQSTAD